MLIGAGNRSQHMSIRALATVAFLLVLTVSARALAQGDAEHIDPQTWKSQNGEWVLHMDPTNPQGEGKASYHLTGSRKAGWSATLDWTLRDARVSNAGAVIGYAYDSGYMGWGGNLVAIVIDPDGIVLASDEHKRDGPAMAIDPPPPGEPRGNGVILDEDGDRGIVRATVNVSGRGNPSVWWVYHLSNGKLISEFNPPQPASGDLKFSREIAAELVPGTGLVLVHWYVYGSESARFDLLDREGKSVWSKDIEGEYAHLGDRWRWWSLFEDRVRQIEVSPSAFTIASYSLKKRLSFGVEHKVDGAWSVDEKGAVDGEPSSSPRRPTEWEPRALTLEMRGEITLGTPSGPTPISGITDLHMDGMGRMGWVRWADNNGSVRFVLVNQDGTVLHDLPLDIPKHEHGSLPTAAWLKDDRWIVAQSVYAADGGATGEAFFLDTEANKLTPLPQFEAGSLVHLSATGDGGFVCLSSLSGNYTIRQQVVRYDAEGKPQSGKTTPGYGQGDMISDVCVLTDGSVAELVDPPGAVVKVYRPGVDAPEVWKLTSEMGGGFIYVAHIRPDKDGGLIVHESSERPVLYRFDKNQKLWQTLRVRGPNDESFRLYDALAVAPDGHVWVSDHMRLFRLDDTGKADKALGGPPEGSMAEPVALTFDKDGAIYALEKGTACVHIFEPDGKPRRVLRPLPTDVPTQDALAWIQVSDDGKIRYRMTWEGRVMVFAADGTRIGPEPKGDDDYKTKFRAIPGFGGKWETDYQSMRRVNQENVAVQTITRRPGGEWFRNIKAAAAAPDGSLAVICQESRGGPFADMGPPADGPWLCIYSPEGKGIAEQKIPPVSYALNLSFDGKRALIRDDKSVTVVPVPFAAPSCWTIPDKGKNYWTVQVDPKTGDWLTWAHESYKIQRWRAPK
jgi:hypothetical protein